jgi:hypothetical protein
MILQSKTREKAQEVKFIVTKKAFKVKKFFFCILSFLCFTVFASEASATAGDIAVGLAKTVLIDPLVWLQDINQLVGGITWTDTKTGVTSTSAIDLPGVVQKLGIAFLLFGIIWNGLKMADVGISTELKPFFVRLLLASMLVFGSKTIGDGIYKSWESTFIWGRDVVAVTAINQSAVSLTGLAAQTAIVGGAYAALPVLLEGVKIFFLKNPADAVKDAASSIKGSMDTLGQILQFLLGALATITGSYYSVILISGFTIFVGNILLPLAGGIMMITGGTNNQWFTMWLRSVCGALIMTLFMPIIFAATLNFGFTQPANNFNRNFQDSAKSITEGVENLKGVAGSLSKADPAGAAEKAVKAALSPLKAAGQLVWAYTFGFVASIIMLIIGVIFSVVIIYAAQQQVMNFVGSFMGGAQQGGAAGQQALGSVGGAMGSAAGAYGSVAMSAAVTGVDAATGGLGSKAEKVSREAGGGGGSSSPSGSGSSPSGGGGGVSRQAGNPGGSGGASSPNSPKSSGAGFGTSTLKTKGSSSPNGGRKSNSSFGSNSSGSSIDAETALAVFESVQ